jgi:hypothetical protein
LTGAEGSIVPEIRKIVKEHLDLASTLHTDGYHAYGVPFIAAKHEVVDHYREFAKTAEEGTRVYANLAEGYFSIFKRGLVGTYQHMSAQHLPRYLAEFDFRMSNRARFERIRCLDQRSPVAGSVRSGVGATLGQVTGSNSVGRIDEINMLALPLSSPRFVRQTHGGQHHRLIEIGAFTRGQARRERP